MNLHAFVINWRGKTRQAEALQRQIAGCAEVCEVLNSDESANGRGWTNLGDVWFGGQVAAMLERCRPGCACLLLCADVASPSLPEVIERARCYMQRLPVGIYTPELVNTYWHFEREKLRHIEDRLYHVPQTDGLCSFFSPSLMAEAARYCHLIRANTLGWGIDALFIALALRSRRWVVRDYTYTAEHMAGRGYGDAEAGRQMDRFFASLPDGLDSQCRQILADASRQRSDAEWPSHPPPSPPSPPPQRSRNNLRARRRKALGLA